MTPPFGGAGGGSFTKAVPNPEDINTDEGDVPGNLPGAGSGDEPTGQGQDDQGNPIVSPIGTGQSENYQGIVFYSIRPTLADGTPDPQFNQVLPTQARLPSTEVVFIPQLELTVPIKYVGWWFDIPNQYSGLNAAAQAAQQSSGGSTAPGLNEFSQKDLDDTAGTSAKLSQQDLIDHARTQVQLLASPLAPTVGLNIMNAGTVVPNDSENLGRFGNILLVNDGEERLIGSTATGPGVDASPLDPVRTTVGRVWTQDELFNVKQIHEDEAWDPIDYSIFELSTMLPVKPSVVVSDTEDDPILMTSISENRMIVIGTIPRELGDTTAKNKDARRIEKLVNYLQANPDQKYFDYYTQYVTPKASSLTIGGPNQRTFDFDSTYVSYIPQYESAASETPESVLPNLNVSIVEQLTSDFAGGGTQHSGMEETDLWKFVTLDGFIQDSFTDILDSKGKVIGEKDVGQYFDKWATVALSPSVSVDRVINNLKKKFDSLILPFSSNTEISKGFDTRFLFPMFVEAIFKTDTKTELADIIIDAMKLDHPAFEEKPSFDYAVLKRVLDKKQLTATERKEGMFIAQRPDVSLSESFVVSNSYDYVDLIRWINGFNAAGKDYFLDSATLGEGAEYTALPLTRINNGGGTLRYQPRKDAIEFRIVEDENLRSSYIPPLADAMAELINSKTRDLNEIYAGYPASSEDLFYRVEKIKVVNEVEEVVQEYYISNSSEIDIYKFVDTQVQYDQEYIYRFYAWRAIFGNEIEYKLINGWGVEGIAENGSAIPMENAEIPVSAPWVKLQCKVFAESKPSLKVIELPYYQFKTRVVDLPPMFPSIDFIPYRGINDKILININANSGEYQAEPIAILEEDSEKIFKQAVAQKIGVFGREQALEQNDASLLKDANEYMFRTDDPPSSFEMFRTTTPPESYLDFKDAEYSILDTDGLSSISLRDGLTANTKYYYTFRTIDIHNNLSNPTTVYEIELVSADGAVYLVVKGYEFPKPELEPRKNGRKYLNITPAFEQSVLNVPQTLDEGFSYANRDPVLGIRDISTFDEDKKFKIRLTSKSTGRKIDLNVKFKLTKKESETEKQITVEAEHALWVRGKKSASSPILFGEDDKFKDKSVVTVGQAETFKKGE